LNSEQRGWTHFGDDGLNVWKKLGVYDADLDTAVGGARLLAVAWNTWIGFAKTLGAHDSWRNSGLHQKVADRFGTALGKLQIVCLRANIVGISVYINRISLKSHQNPGDAVQDVAVFGFDVGLVEVEANRLAIERHHQSHRGEAGLRDLSKRLLQLCKFRFAFLAILLSLLRGFIRLLLLGGGLLARKLRLSLRVCLRLFRQVALLGGCLRVSSCLRSLLSQGLRLLLCALDQLPETLCLLIELRHLSLQATGRP